MYNIDLTGSFAGMSPSSISLSPDDYWAGVAFYKDALQATEDEDDASELASAYGFSFEVDAAGETGQTIRLHLTSQEDRQEVADALDNGEGIAQEDGLLVVTDKYDVTWQIA